MIDVDYLKLHVECIKLCRRISTAARHHLVGESSWPSRDDSIRRVIMAVFPGDKLGRDDQSRRIVSNVIENRNLVATILQPHNQSRFHLNSMLPFYRSPTFQLYIANGQSLSCAVLWNLFSTVCFVIPYAHSIGNRAWQSVCILKLSLYTRSIYLHCNTKGNVFKQAYP